jgi:hypothetical protein
MKTMTRKGMGMVLQRIVSVTMRLVLADQWALTPTTTVGF